MPERMKGWRTEGMFLCVYSAGTREVKLLRVSSPEEELTQTEQVTRQRTTFNITSKKLYLDSENLYLKMYILHHLQ